MREILFRGKRIDNGEWVEGFFVAKVDPLLGIMTSLILTQELDANGILRSNMTWHKVDPETVGQYTGRIGKNGKKVFENDILQMFTIWEDGTIGKGLVCAVQWLTNDQCYVLTRGGSIVDDFGNYGRPEYYEIIGNIHDNPELLEEG